MKVGVRADDRQHTFSDASTPISEVARVEQRSAAFRRELGLGASRDELATRRMAAPDRGDGGARYNDTVRNPLDLPDHRRAELADLRAEDPRAW